MCVVPRPGMHPGRESADSRCEIISFLWDGGNEHKSREAAAQNLAAVIDKKASDFDRVCLVGHSHGGNIALRAAGLCRTKIRMLVCLSTPHAYLNLIFHSLVPPAVTKQHSAVHSRRMGYVVGELLQYGTSKDCLNYIRTIVQPADADGGEPIATPAQTFWMQNHQQDFRQVGWRLDGIRVELNPAATIRGKFHVHLLTRRADGTKQSVDEFPPQQTPGSWRLNLILWNGETALLNIREGHLLSDTNLGEDLVTAAAGPPADTSRGPLWSAKLDWKPVHY